ncbi:putative YccA/Bax inhibitor family protein [Methanococcus maripaludis]|uniref:Putative YccA/Bax inhibitor family protein n=1 Tax=Methanococcus maripaludis TaxID=39152 RepID=A0A7J9P615_METMI|nr:Bax inhibitor-1/YccA family protein [Methanococcus maripaludis]MBA2858194.1 putative YccA/Bax inhibitor family protein [Methanococcus maripaludis]
MRTSNPTLSSDTFTGFNTYEQNQQMTVNGTVNKTIISLGIVSISAYFSWDVLFFSPYSNIFLIAAPILGFLVALATIFKKEWSPATVPVYCILEGLFLGLISGFFELMYPGIVFQAVVATFGVLLSLLLAYKSKLIRATENFKLGVVAATGGIALVYIASIILGFFGISIPLIFGSGPVGILFSVFVVIIAALNLVLDFDFIEQGERYGAPKYMEWYGAFGLMVTLIWLYLEILKLLSKLRSRD